MTDKRIRELVVIWQERLGLDRHKIDVEFHPGNDEKTIAEARGYKNYERGTLRFYRDEMSKLDDRDTEATVVHELIHMAHKEVEKFLESIDGQLHRDVFTIAENVFYDTNERFVDRMAYVLLRAYES